MGFSLASIPGPRPTLRHCAVSPSHFPLRPRGSLDLVEEKRSVPSTPQRRNRSPPKIRFPPQVALCAAHTPVGAGAFRSHCSPTARPLPAPLCAGVFGNPLLSRLPPTDLGTPPTARIARIRSRREEAFVAPKSAYPVPRKSRISRVSRIPRKS